ncbi:MAG: Caldesmon [Flavobacteriales bacterium BRH_c54]|nr:MAG: Caldesmon [Flavobacteriales bacterium BRH_c54]
MKNETKIKCPKCGTSIDVQDILAHQLEEEIKQKYQAQIAEEKKKYEAEQDKLKQEKLDFEQKKKQENELFQERFDKKLKEEKSLMEEKLKAKLTEEQSEQFAALQKELNEKSEQVKELNRSKAEIERLKREKSELKEAAEAEAQKKLNEMLLTEKEKIRKVEEDRNELKFKELQKQLEDQKKLTEEMKRKQEQGSMQMQGEVQELAIEEWLAIQFPLDTIEEIKKGVRGGDCIQIVNTRTEQNCGKIYYESKRTKDFQPSWIEKFKTDIRDKGANIGVLVTEVMPSDMDRMGLKDGIWICNYAEFKGLCNVLRESIVQINLAVSSQENKGDKMHMLYDYLTSNQFRMQIEAIVEGFTSMKTALDSEKRAMQRIWKEREKQIDKVTANTIDMHASIKGIAGNAIQSVQALELPNHDDDDEQSQLELE